MPPRPPPPALLPFHGPVHLRHSSRSAPASEAIGASLVGSAVPTAQPPVQTPLGEAQSQANESPHPSGGAQNLTQAFFRQVFFFPRVWPMSR